MKNLIRRIREFFRRLRGKVSQEPSRLNKENDWPGDEYFKPQADDVIATVPLKPTHPAWSDNMVTTPGGRQFPAPDPHENGWGYIGRIGTFLGRQDDWRRLSGTIMLGTDHLVPRSVPREQYGAWKSDPRSWPVMAENFWFPVAQPVDPGWQQVHDRLQEPRTEKPAAPAAPQLPPGEEPL